MNILHINTMHAEEISSLVVGASESLDSKSVTVFTNEESFDGYDVIVLGIGDGGVCLAELNPGLFEATVAAHDRGAGILFTHDCPTRRCFETYDLSSLGFAPFVHDYAYNMYTAVAVKDAAHAIVTTPYDLSGGFTVEQTHGVGTCLAEDCRIVIDNPAIPATSTNFYLAVREEVGKGRIAYWAFGHNRYNSETFYQPSGDECRLFTNILEWLSAPVASVLYGNLT